jgi:tetratricopeptide (TPR) repeat protein
VGDEHRALQAIQMVAWCHRETGDVARSNVLYEELLRDARDARDGQLESVALSLLAGAAREEGRFRDALAYQEEAYRFDHDFGDRMEIVTDLMRFALILADLELPEAVVRLLASTDAVREDAGLQYPEWVERWYREPALERARAALDARQFALAWEEGRQLAPDEAVALALDAGGRQAQGP